MKSARPLATADCAGGRKTPEYNCSTPGVHKNSIDWAARPLDSPLDGKPMAIMGAGGRFGTVRAQMHLQRDRAAEQHARADRPRGVRGRGLARVRR